MIKPIFLVAFSGHRPKKGIPGRSPSELAACKAIIKKALEKILTQANSDECCINLVCSLAEGADLAAAEAAKELRIPTHFFLPFDEERFEKDFIDSPEAWKKVKFFIKRGRRRINGSSVRVAESDYGQGLDSNTSYCDTNYALLKHADALITVAIDPQKISDTKVDPAGTQQVWTDAGVRRIPRINIDPSIQKITVEESFDLMTKRNPENPTCGINLLSKLADHLGEPLDKKSTDNSLLDSKSLFDLKANDLARFVRTGLRNIILCHGAASLIAALALAHALTYGKSYTVLFWLAIIELCLIGYAELLHSKNHHKGVAWLQCRAAAENLNMLSNMRSHVDPLETVVSQHSPSWHRFVLSFNLQSCPTYRFSDIKEAKQDYLDNRIEDQITYFSKKSRESIKPSVWLYRSMRYSSFLALAIVSIAAFDKSGHAFHWLDLSLPKIGTFICYFLPVALPLLAGTFLALRQSLDISRRHHRYPEVITLLENTKKDLASVHSYYTLQKVVTQVEESLLDERLEFDTAQKMGFEH